MKRLYGISLEDYEKILVSQNGVCYICLGLEPTKTRTGKEGKRLAVDHDHKTGKIRGLLCSQCNKLLGNAKDSIEILEKCIEYLKKHKVDINE